MLGVGKKFPAFNLKGVSGTDPKTAFTDIHHQTYEGKWLVVFFRKSGDDICEGRFRICSADTFQVECGKLLTNT